MGSTAIALDVDLIHGDLSLIEILILLSLMWAECKQSHFDMNSSAIKLNVTSLCSYFWNQISIRLYCLLYNLVQIIYKLFTPIQFHSWYHWNLMKYFTIMFTSYFYTKNPVIRFKIKKISSFKAHGTGLLAFLDVNRKYAC